MKDFWGRRREHARLLDELNHVRRSGQGRMLAVRGRRQTGKSRLLTEFAETSAVAYLFATAIKNADPAMQLTQVMADLRASNHPLPGMEEAFAAPATSWTDFFARLPLAFAGKPAIVVLDEFPWASETDDTLEGVLQHAWDRVLEGLPILMVLVGSDLAMMERLTQHDRPLYGRAAEMVVEALTPAEVAEAFSQERTAFELLDIHLATGGYPRLVSHAREHRSFQQFIAAQLQDDQSALSVTGLRLLDAEFRENLQARSVLEAIGSVEVGHATFSSAVAQLSSDSATAGTAITRALPALVDDKRLVAIDLPVGAQPTSRLRRYRIVDPYLRFWFRYCAPHLADMARGRADLATDHFARDFPSWRGRAIEPVVRQAVSLLATMDSRLTGIAQVGSWWNRKSDHEFDVVGTARAGEIALIGTIKWRARKAIHAGEMTDLAQARTLLRGAADAKSLVVCPAGARSGITADIVLDANDVLRAFRESSSLFAHPQR